VPITEHVQATGKTADNGDVRFYGASHRLLCTALYWPEKTCLSVFTPHTGTVPKRRMITRSLPANSPATSSFLRCTLNPGILEKTPLARASNDNGVGKTATFDP